MAVETWDHVVSSAPPYYVSGEQKYTQLVVFDGEPWVIYISSFDNYLEHLARFTGGAWVDETPNLTANSHYAPGDILRAHIVAAAVWGGRLFVLSQWGDVVSSDTSVKCGHTLDVWDGSAWSNLYDQVDSFSGPGIVASVAWSNQSAAAFLEREGTLWFTTESHGQSVGWSTTKRRLLSIDGTPSVSLLTEYDASQLPAAGFSSLAAFDSLGLTGDPVMLGLPDGGDSSGPVSIIEHDGTEVYTPPYPDYSGTHDGANSVIVQWDSGTPESEYPTIYQVFGEDTATGHTMRYLAKQYGYWWSTGVAQLAYYTVNQGVQRFAAKEKPGGTLPSSDYLYFLAYKDDGTFGGIGRYWIEYAYMAEGGGYVPFESTDEAVQGGFTALYYCPDDNLIWAVDQNNGIYRQAGGTGDIDPPTAPSNLQATNITSTSFLLTWDAATDNVGVTGYRVYRDGTQVADVSGLSATVSGLSPATTYSMTVRAYDAAGNLGPASSALDVTTGGDITPPSVSILSPTTGSTVATDIVEIEVYAADNVAIATVDVAVQGQSIGPQTPADATGIDTYTFDWDTISWDNGTYSIVATATDTAGNSSVATITLTLSRSLANATQWIVTRQLPITDDQWNLSGKNVARFIETFSVPYVDPDPGRNYDIQAMIHVPGDTTDHTEYQPITRRESFLTSADAATFRLGWLLTPSAVTATWATNSAQLAFPTVVEGDTNALGFWGWAEKRLYRFSNDTVATLANLNTDLIDYDIYDLEYADGSWWLAVAPSAPGTGVTGVMQVDVDAASSDQRYWIVMPHAETPTALAVYDDDLYIGTDDGDGTGQLFRYDFETNRLYQVGDCDPVSCMAGVDAGVLIGTTTGNIYMGGSSSVGLIFTGASASVDWIGQAGTAYYASIGAYLYSTITGSWAYETTFVGETTLSSVVEWRSQRWASFDSQRLWRYNADGGWTVALTLDDYVSVDGLAILDDALYGLVRDASTARLWRREIPEPSDTAVRGRWLSDIAVELLETTTP